MPEISHNVAVIAGRKGSSTRTKKINKMLNEIDSLVADARKKKEENGEHTNLEKVLVSSSYLADQLNFSRATINRNGFPTFFKRYYDSVKHKPKKGIVIKIDQWVEERKEDRKELSKVNND